MRTRKTRIVTSLNEVLSRLAQELRLPVPFAQACQSLNEVLSRLAQESV